MNKEKKTGTDMSASKQKRLDRQKKNHQAKRNNLLTKVITIAVVVVILGGIGYAVGSNVYQKVNSVKPANNYGEYLTENGFIKDVDAASCLNLTDYKNITVPLSEIEFTDEEVEENIQDSLQEFKELDTSATPIADGDEVNIDYVGTVDGVEFEGGSSNDQGYNLVIGSGSFIDDFEQQLIGHKTDENVTVNVTFPDDYQKEELAGKDAVFSVTIHGIQRVPELTDAFVKEHFSENASTVEEYRNYIKETNTDKNLENYLVSYLSDNTEVTSYPAAYLKNLMQTTKYETTQSFEMMKQMYASYNMQEMSFEDFVGMTESEYDKNLKEECQGYEKKALIYQAILEKEGVTVTADDYKAYLEETEGDTASYDSMISSYGEGYTAQTMVSIKALELVKGYVTIE